MNILITAGNTQTPVDQVRCITSIFSGRTGAKIAVDAFDRGHSVVFLTSHPEALGELPSKRHLGEPGIRVRPYRTFDDLEAAMADEIARCRFDVIIHAAAVSDYRVAGVFTQRDGCFEEASAGKVKGSHPELWLKLVPTPKLVDKIRTEWRFSGVLVKFKLEVGLSESELRDVAEKARVHSRADLMVANTLEGMHDWALMGTARGYAKVPRDELAERLLEAVEKGGRS